jgi:hypothetical protein
VLTQKQLPNTLPAANTAEAGLNNETSTLMRNLMAQSGGNGTQLTIANAVWTNKTSVLKPYSDSMLKLFQVRRDNCYHRELTHSRVAYGFPAAAVQHTATESAAPCAVRCQLSSCSRNCCCPIAAEMQAAITAVRTAAFIWGCIATRHVFRLPYAAFAPRVEVFALVARLQCGRMSRW